MQWIFFEYTLIFFIYGEKIEIRTEKWIYGKDFLYMMNLFLMYVKLFLIHIELFKYTHWTFLLIFDA